MLLTCARLLLRPSQRRRFVREIQIRRTQDSLIGQQYDRMAENVVVYIVDGADWVTGKEKMSGGLLSIASMFEEARRLPELSSHQVIMVTLDSLPLILRHTEFENDISVFRLSQVFSHFKRLRHLIINVPELLVSELPRQLLRAGRRGLIEIERLHVNILNQNNQKMPGPESVEALKRIVPQVTMTTAHWRCRPEEMSRKYAIAAHHLSTFVSPEQYRHPPYAEKCDLLVASPDEHPMKAAVLERVRSRLPRVRFQIIRKLTYGEYKATMERAKWSVTFGEGMDGYFVESVFSGGISFAVYNDEFFPAEFKGLPTIFDSYERMHEELPAMLERLDTPSAYAECHDGLFDVLKEHYRYDEYLKKLGAFYRGDFDSTGDGTLCPRNSRSPCELR